VTRHLRRRTDNPQAGGRVQRPRDPRVERHLWSAATTAASGAHEGEVARRSRLGQVGRAIRAGGKAPKAKRPPGRAGDPPRRGRHGGPARREGRRPEGRGSPESKEAGSRGAAAGAEAKAPKEPKSR
jgi:hypothetical protein